MIGAGKRLEKGGKGVSREEKRNSPGLDNVGTDYEADAANCDLVVLAAHSAVDINGASAIDASQTIRCLFQVQFVLRTGLGSDFLIILRVGYACTS